MGQIRVHEFVSLDGVYESPSWTAEYPFDPKMGAAIGAITEASKGVLLGRKTWEMFWPAWSTRTAEDDPGAPFFNETTKYVVTSTLESVDEWNNSTIVGPYDAGALRELKEGLDGDLYVSGSGTLVRAMLADGLVDELNLFVFPVALGSGERLFGEGRDQTKFELAETEPYDSGVLRLTYRPAA